MEIENQVTNSQPLEKRKIISKWTFLIPLAQILSIVILFFFLSTLAFAPSIAPVAYLAYFFVFVIFAPPILLFIIWLVPIKKYSTLSYFPIMFVVSFVVPVLVLCRQPFVDYMQHKNSIKEEQRLYELGYGEKRMQEEREAANKIENYSVATMPATNVTETSVTLNGVITNTANTIPPANLPHFLYGTSKEKLNNISTRGISFRVIGPFSSPVINLQPHTTYYYKAVLDFNATPKPENNQRLNGDILSFTTL